MARHDLNVHYVDVPPMPGLGVRVRELCANVALTVTGYLRPRPDPALENALRSTFACLDRDLAEILGDRIPGNRLDRWPLSAQEQ